MPAVELKSVERRRVRIPRHKGPDRCGLLRCGCQQSPNCHVMTSRCVRIVPLNSRYPRYRTEQMPVPPVFWSRYTGTRGTGIEFIPNLPKCRVLASRPCQTNTRHPGMPLYIYRLCLGYIDNTTLQASCVCFYWLCLD